MSFNIRRGDKNTHQNVNDFYYTFSSNPTYFNEEVQQIAEDVQ